MAVNNTQYLSFLGGLVSPRLWLRSDIDKFGKWFSEATNIRFSTIGSFENIFGTIKVSNTYRNSYGENIKLLKFDFGAGETCILELSNNHCVVYVRDEETNIHTATASFDTEIELSSSDDIKYTQSGDIIFLTYEKGIYEIKRLTKDFTQWSIEKFNFKDEIVPLSEENDDESKTIAVSAANGQTTVTYYYFETTLPSPTFGDTFSDVTVRIRNNNTGTWETIFRDDTLEFNRSSFVNNFNANQTGGHNIVCELTSATNGIKFNLNSTDGGIYNKINIIVENGIYNSLTIQTPGTSFDSIEDSTWHTKTGTGTLTVNSNYVVSSYSFNYGKSDHSSGYFSYTYQVPVPASTALSSLYSAAVARGDSSKISYDSVSNTINATWETAFYQKPFDYSTRKQYYYGFWSLKATYHQAQQYSIESNLTTYTETYPIPVYVWTATSNFDFFKYGTTDGKVDIGDTFAIRNIIQADYIHATRTGYTTSTVTTETGTVQVLKSDGNWRYNSSGLWSGEIKLDYSTDSGATWITFFNRKNSSYSNYSTTNDNTSGKIVSDKGTILIRMVVSNISEDNDSKFSAELAVDKFEVNSYYKVKAITSARIATVDVLKNDVGNVAASAKWRDAEFSSYNGYPTAIGFYQNRLYFAKGYTLYGSRINDFWDFYEPIEVADDDPVVMSLLGYKINNIQNLIGIRSFFAFTTDGEFGIGSDSGALTQATKYLKQISAHGSNPCNPIFCGDVILFVDKTNNTVRAFKYSLEADGWEATDVSVLIEQILDDKNIITTEYLQDTKECLFLTSDGDIFVFKFFPEQNIAAWYIWRHPKYKITNLCSISDSLGKDYLYIACDTDNGKQIEMFNRNIYSFSTLTFSSDTDFSSVSTSFQEGDKVVVNDGTDIYLSEVGVGGAVTLRNATKYATVGLSYTSIATLLSPEIQDRDGTFSTYNRKRPFKVYCFYRDSYGFKIGVEEESKQEIQFQPVWADVDDETALTTGKASVLIPARYDGSSRVSFVQDKPYPMIIENVLLETDYGGK